MAAQENLKIVEKKKLYVGCGLTLAPQAFKDEVERTKEELGRDWEVMQFLGTTAGTEVDVYEVDIIRNVGNCDAFVGVMDEPSWGLGWESHEAVEKGKPTLLVAHVASKITRLALGAPHFVDMSFRRYEDMIRDVPEIVREEFAGILNQAT
ncbi:MAG TPA: hypothetical protein VLF90_02220 [Patescibacteria group bacterium]|nr:hypothetical protein [Patescibacteria group bacterium]